MAFPVVSARTQGATAATTTPSITLPSGSAGELLLAVVSVQGAATVDWAGVGFSLLVENAGDDTISIGYRWTDGTEDASISPTLSASAETAYSVLRITGALHPLSGGLQISTIATGSSTTPDPSSLTPTGGAKDYLWIAVGNTNNGNRTYLTAPLNYSNLNAADSASAGVGTSVGTAERQLNAASEDPGAFAISLTTTWKAFTVVVHPAVPTSLILPPSARRMRPFMAR